MLRLALPLTIALSLPFAVMACGSDTSSTTCGAGTHLENGTCVADNTGDTSNGTDTFQQADSTNATDTTTNPTDTGAGTDTVETDTAINTECTPDEAGVRELGAACTKDCQCEQEHQLFCNDGPYMAGFRFCTSHGLGTASKPDSWIFTSTNSACPGWENSHEDDRVYVRACETLDDCKAIASQYTHCGTTGVFGPTAASDTRCCGDATISTQKTCLVIDTPPFNNCGQ